MNLADVEILWQDLIDLHLKTKSHTLLGEELDERFFSFLHPMKEHRDVYDHLIRAGKHGFGKQSISDDELNEVCRNLDKAIGHELRAYLDTAGFISIILRVKISEMTLPFSSEIIVAHVKNFFTQITPDVEMISQTIAKLRNDERIENDPDVENIKNVLAESPSIEVNGSSKTEASYKVRVKEFDNQLDRLLVHYNTIAENYGYFIDDVIKLKKKRNWYVTISYILIPFISVFVAFGLVLFR